MGTRRVAGIVLGLLLVALAGLAVAQDAVLYTQTQDIVYSDIHGTGLLMDVFVPKGAKNDLGIVDVASGAWHSDRGKIEDHKRGGTYDVFCGRGYVVFAIRPGSVDKYTAQEMLQNLKRGIRFVKLHAADYGIDPERLGLTGASAGGHLATLATVTAEGPKPDAEKPIDKLGTQVKATAVFFPPTDFLDWGGNAVDFKARMKGLLYNAGVEGHSDAEIAEAARQISPARLVGPSLPPFLFVHGDGDSTVPLQQSQKMLDAIKVAGGSAELVVKAGGGHAWPTIREEVGVMANWFDKQLGSAAAPEPGKPGDEQQVADTMAKWRSAILAKNVDQMMAFYSENYKSSRASGKVAIAEYLKSAVSQGYLDGIKIDVEKARVTASGDKATITPVELSSSQGSLTMKYELAKENGQWLIVAQATASGADAQPAAPKAQPAATPAPEESAEKQVSETMAKWKTALLAKDVDGMVALYSENYKSSRGSGKASVAEFLKNVFSSGYLDDAKVDVEKAKISVSDDKAVVSPVVLNGSQGSMDMRYDLAKEKGQWLIVAQARASADDALPAAPKAQPASAPAPAPEKTAEQLIADTMSKWKSALVAKNIDELATLYSENYKSEQANGKAAVVQYLKGVANQGYLDGLTIDVEKAKITVQGDKATVSPVHLAGAQFTMDVRYDLAKENGRWLIVGVGEA